VSLDVELDIIRIQVSGQMCFVSLEKVIVDKKDKKLLIEKVKGATKLIYRNSKEVIKTHQKTSVNYSNKHVHTSMTNHQNIIYKVERRCVRWTMYIDCYVRSLIRITKDWEKRRTVGIAKSNSIYNSQLWTFRVSFQIQAVILLFNVEHLGN